MEYILGIIIGLVIAVLVMIVATRNQASINRKLNQTASAIRKKGEIIEPDNEDVKEWVDGLKEQ